MDNWVGEKWWERLEGVELFTYQLLVGEEDRVVSVVLFSDEGFGEGRLFIHGVQPNSLQRLIILCSLEVIEPYPTMLTDRRARRFREETFQPPGIP